MSTRGGRQHSGGGRARGSGGSGSGGSGSGGSGGPSGPSQTQNPFAGDRVRHEMYEWERVSARLAKSLRGNAAFAALSDHILSPLERAGALSRLGERISGLVRHGKREQAAAFYLLGRYHTTFAHENTPLHIAMLHAARDEFGLRDAKIGAPPAAEARAQQEYGAVEPGLRAFVRAMYQQTQRDLAARGITQVTLYRAVLLHAGNQPEGLRDNSGPHQVTMTSKAITSYSMDARAAASYTDMAPHSMMVRVTLPVSRILSTGYTGFGAFGRDQEIVALGGRDRVLASAKRVTPSADALPFSDADLAQLRQAPA